MNFRLSRLGCFNLLPFVFVAALIGASAQQPPDPASAQDEKRPAEEVAVSPGPAGEPQEPGRDRPPRRRPRVEAENVERLDPSRREEVQRNLESAEAELHELRSEGKESEARAVERRVDRLRSLLERGERDRVVRPRREGPDRPAPAGRPGNDPERRLHHLEIAIENLHEADMHEPADELSRHADELRAQMRGPSRRGPDAPPGFEPRSVPRAELERLRAELNELRRSIQELRARLEKVR